MGIQSVVSDSDKDYKQKIVWEFISRNNWQKLCESKESYQENTFQSHASVFREKERDQTDSHCWETGSQATAWKATKGSLLQRDGHIAEIIPALAFDRLAPQHSPLFELLCADFSMGALKLGHDCTFHYQLCSPKPWENNNTFQNLYLSI